jgi:glycosyltransferase involved in cell wall biosynthesis
MPFFSVIIPTYNRRDRTVRAVRSVLAQRFADYEIVVVDDGSADGTGDAVAALHPGIRVLRQPNRGAAAARNAGISASRGEWVAFLDSDDLWLPWTLEHYAAVISEHRPTWLCATGFLDLGAPESERREEARVVRTYPCYLESAAQSGIMPMMNGVAVRREALERLGGFPEVLRVGEDFDLWLRLGSEPGFALIESPIAFIREHHAASLTEDIGGSYRGLLDLARRDRAGRYGGEEGAFARRGMISRHLVYYAIRYVRKGRRARAVRFWLEVARIQAAARFREPAFGGSRNRFLLTFPLFLVSPRLHATLRRWAGRPPLP